MEQKAEVPQVNPENRQIFPKLENITEAYKLAIRGIERKMYGKGKNVLFHRDCGLPFVFFVNPEDMTKEEKLMIEDSPRMKYICSYCSDATTKKEVINSDEIKVSLMRGKKYIQRLKQQLMRIRLK